MMPFVNLLNRKKLLNFLKLPRKLELDDAKYLVSHSLAAAMAAAVFNSGME